MGDVSAGDTSFIDPPSTDSSQVGVLVGATYGHLVLGGRRRPGERGTTLFVLSIHRAPASEVTGP